MINANVDGIPGIQSKHLRITFLTEFSIVVILHRLKSLVVDSKEILCLNIGILIHNSNFYSSPCFRVDPPTVQVPQWILRVSP